MKAGFGLIAILLSASAGTALVYEADDGPLDQALIAMERQSWVAWQGHDARFWEAFLSEDHVEIHGGGIVGKAEVVALVRSGACRVERYALDRFTVTRIGPDTALLTYRADQATRCGDEAVPTPVWVTSLYQRRAGRWLNVLYGHTPVTVP